MFKLFALVLLADCCLGQLYYYNKETKETIPVKEGDAPPDSNKYILVKSPDEAFPIQVTEPCPEEAFTCAGTPPSHNSSIRYLCKTSEQCPDSYFCCMHKCFVNAVCVKRPSSKEPAEDKENGGKKKHHKNKGKKDHKKRAATTSAPKKPSRTKAASAAPKKNVFFQIN